MDDKFCAEKNTNMPCGCVVCVIQILSTGISISSMQERKEKNKLKVIIAFIANRITAFFWPNRFVLFCFL